MSPPSKAGFESPRPLQFYRKPKRLDGSHGSGESPTHDQRWQRWRSWRRSRLGLTSRTRRAGFLVPRRQLTLTWMHFTAFGTYCTACRFRKQWRLKMPKIEDMQLDPELFNENDPEVVEEMFEQYNYSGFKPEDLPNMKPVLRKQYGEWLESQKA